MFLHYCLIGFPLSFDLCPSKVCMPIIKTNTEYRKMSPILILLGHQLKSETVEGVARKSSTERQEQSGFLIKRLFGLISTNERNLHLQCFRRTFYLVIRT